MERLSEEGPHKLGKVLYSDSNDRFKVSWFYLSFRKQPEWGMDCGGWGASDTVRVESRPRKKW